MTAYESWGNLSHANTEAHACIGVGRGKCGRMRLTLGAFFKLRELERRVDASGSRQNVRKETIHALHDPLYRFLQHGMASVLGLGL